MKTTFINSLGALALAGLSVSLLPANASAHEIHRGEHRMHRDFRCARLPHGARCVTYGGERCWYSSGCYYRVHPLGGYVVVRPTYETAVVRQPVIEKTIVVKRPVVRKKIVQEEVVEEAAAEQPVVEEKEIVNEQPVVEESQTTVEEPAPVVEEQEEAPALEEEETVVEALPEGSEVVVIGGERCWLRDGVYYRRCDRGYKVCHPHGNKGTWEGRPHHFPMGSANSKPTGSHPHPAKHFPNDMGNHTMGNHNMGGHNMGNHQMHPTGNMGHMNNGGGHAHDTGKHDKH